MLCSHCGQPIREGARFCNHCGTPLTAAPAAGNATSDASAQARVSQTAALDANPPEAVAQPVPATQPIPDDELTPYAFPPPPQATPERTPPFAAAPEAPDLAPARAAGASAAPVLMPSPDGTSFAAPNQPNQPDDRLPWPLPAGIIVDGRYRVESLLQSSDESNSYQVTDLRGFERCWVCGQVYGASGASDRFCRECGADMLGRELVLWERRTAAGGEAEGSATPDQKGDDEAPDLPRRFRLNGRDYVVEAKATQGRAFPRGARLVAGAATDAGHGRSGDHNEDSAVTLIVDRYYEDFAQPMGLFVVADGMGGHASGHRASRLVANVLTHTVLRQLAMPALGSPVDLPLDDDRLATLLRDAVRAANNSLCAANQEADLDAGSTLVAALVAGETAHIANAGDSRCYAFDLDTGLRRITADHSLVQQLVAGGMIHPDDVYTHPERNKIFRSLGDDPDLAVDLFVQQFKPGMRLLLCCDGLWEMVRDPQIEQILREAPDPQAAADVLITAANDGGGDDNITVIVLEAR